MNMVSGLFRGHPIHRSPSPSAMNAAIDEYQALQAQFGDNPNAIADHMGVTRGTGCVLRRMLNERYGDRAL